MIFRHTSRQSRPHGNPNHPSSLTSPPDPKRCLVEFSPLPPVIICRTIVLMEDSLNSPVALSQSRTQNEPVLLHNVTKCYTVTREPPDETMRLVSPDCHPTKGTGFRSIPSDRKLGFGVQASIQGRLICRTTSFGTLPFGVPSFRIRRSRAIIGQLFTGPLLLLCSLTSTPTATPCPTTAS